MTFEADFARLDNLRKGLKLAGLAAFAGAALGLLAMCLFDPGPFGGPLKFTDIQIHLDLVNHYGALGLPMKVFDDRMLFGMRFSQIQAADDLIENVLTIAIIVNLFRRKWRLLAGCIVAFVFMASIGQLWVSHVGYYVADARDFGADQAPMNPGIARGYQTILDNRRLAGRNDRIAKIDRIFTLAPDASRAERARRIRAELEGPMTGMTPAEQAAMHYTAAQLAYIKNDIGAEIRHLNAIPVQGFHPTWDSDYRIRVMQEWVEKRRGTGASPEAYVPRTGMPFEDQRPVAAILNTLWEVIFVFAVALFILAGYVASRLKRVRKLASQLAAAPAPVSPGAPALQLAGALRQAFGLRR